MSLTRTFPRGGAWRFAVAWAVVALLVHTVGNETGLYFQFGWYQNLTHAWSASALAGLLAVAGLRLDLRGFRLVAFVIALATVGALTWELVEYVGLLDPLGVPLHFHDVNDAMVDMVSNAVGVSATLGFVWARTGLEPPRASISDEPDPVE